MAKRKIKFNSSRAFNKIIGLSVLVLALAVGVIVVNTRVFNPNSKAGVLDPEGLEGEDFTKWADKYEKTDYEKELIDKANKAGKAPKLYASPTKVDNTTPVADEDIINDPDVDGDGCADDKPGICEPVDCSNAATAWKDCFESEWRGDTTINYKDKITGDYTTLTFGKGDAILYSYDYDYKTGELIGEFRFSYPGATSISVERATNGALKGLDIETNAGNITYDLAAINKGISDFNVMQKNSENKFPVFDTIFSFLNSWVYDPNIVIDGVKGGYKMCPLGGNICMSLQNMEILCGKSCDFSGLSTIEDFNKLKGSIEQVKASGSGISYSGTGYFPITGCAKCQQNQESKGGGGNSKNGASGLIYDIVSNWVAKGTISANNPVYKILQRWNESE